MENKEYTPGQNRPGRRGGMRGPGMGRGPAEKASDFKGTWSELISYCKSYLPVVIIALICAAGGTVLTLLGPDKLSEMTKEIGKGLVTGVDMDAVSKIGFTLIAFYVCGALLSFGQQWIMATVTQNISKKLRGDISGKINRLPMSYYSRSTTGDILSRVTNDVDTISQSMNQSIGNLVSAVTLFVGSLFMMFKTDVIMTITAIVATLIGFVLMTVIAKHSSRYFVRQQRCLGEINGHIEEIYTGHTVIKAYNGEAQAAAEFERMNNNLRESAFRAQCLAGLMPPIMTFIGNLGYVAVCVAGAVLTMKGTTGFEVIAAFIGDVSQGNLKFMIAIIIIVSAVASSLVDNIPFAATMVPVISSLAATQGVDLRTLAWALSMGTDIGGSATPIGASANVVGTSIAPPFETVS